MGYKSFLSSLLIATGIFAPSIGQACQWVRVGEQGEIYECRSNYRNFFKDNSALFNNLLMSAAFLAQGEAERLTIDNWVIRNSVEIPEAHELLEGRFESEQAINDMNAIIRQIEARDGEGEGVQMPSAYMVGVTIPVNGDISRIPGFKRISAFMPNPGGSAFIGWALIPQKVEFRLNEAGALEGPAEYVTEREAPSAEAVAGSLNALLGPAPEEANLQGLGRVRIESRFVVIPSADAKLGTDGKYKNTYLQPTIGMVFGRNIVRSHQILNNGPSISIPGRNLRMIQGLSVLGPWVMPNWLVNPIERHVDTIKVGYSYSGQDVNELPSDENIVQFTENAFVWLRFGDRLKAHRPDTTAADVASGRFRWGWFWNVGVFDDGEANHNQNGLSGEILESVGSGVGDLVTTLLGRSEEALNDMDPASIEEELESLRASIEADDARSADDMDKLSAAVRATVEARIQVLEAALEDANN